MPSRWMQTKIQKIKRARMKRAWAKRLDPEWRVTANDRSMAHELAQERMGKKTVEDKKDNNFLPLPNRQHSKIEEMEVLNDPRHKYNTVTVVVGPDGVKRRPDTDKYGVRVRKFDNTFLHPVPATRVPDALIENPRFQAGARVYRYEHSDKWQKLGEFIKGPLLNRFEGIDVNIYFHGTEYLVIKDCESFRSISITYSSFESATRAFKTGSVTWEMVIDKLAAPTDD